MHTYKHTFDTCDARPLKRFRIAISAISCQRNWHTWNVCSKCNTFIDARCAIHVHIHIYLWYVDQWSMAFEALQNSHTCHLQQEHVMYMNACSKCEIFVYGIQYIELNRTELQDKGRFQSTTAPRSNKVYVIHSSMYSVYEVYWIQLQDKGRFKPTTAPT